MQGFDYKRKESREKVGELECSSASEYPTQPVFFNTGRLGLFFDFVNDTLPKLTRKPERGIGKII